MKCPYCSKEIKDDALFCGFCGKHVLQTPLEEASPAPPADEAKAKASDSVNNVPSETIEEIQNTKPNDKPKKGATELKALLMVVLLAFIGGSVCGGVIARGIVSLESLIPSSNFKWTSFSEGLSETIKTDDTADEKESEKDENLENSAPTKIGAETSPSTETTGSSPERTSPEENLEATENNSGNNS